VRNGVVVLDDPSALPDGTEVSVRPLKAKGKRQAQGDRSRQTIYERYKRFIGAARGLPHDFSVNHDHYLYGTPKRQ
jgi:hypothetical protein